MRVGRLAMLPVLAALVGCAGGQSKVGSSVGQKDAPEVESATESPDALDAEAAGGAAGASPVEDAAAPAEEEQAFPAPLRPAPQLVQALVARTGAPDANDNPLHVRLEVAPQPAGQAWVAAVVNRGTEPASVRFDLRRLTLTLEQPEDPEKPRPRWKKKPAPIVCKLPESFVAALGNEPAPERLEPGEGLVLTFDPRLYCISSRGESLLSRGQTVQVKLGYEPKPPRVVWRHGKRVEEPVLQGAPFVAEPLVAPAEAQPAAAPPVVPEIDPAHDLRVKQLEAREFELTPDLLGGEAEEDPSQPLSLSLVRGSDAASERTATATVALRAKSQKVVVYFRRELLTFTVHGPTGIRACDPQPDDRAPDRQAYSTLRSGRALTATSLLAELCPDLTFGRPGLYLLSARLDAERDGSEFGLDAFTGRLESRKQALVRIRSGELPPLPPPEPLRVRVGESASPEPAESAE